MLRASCLLLLLFALALPTIARADGEAGLVIQHGDGSIDTYCVPFTGDSITGADMLRSRNISVVQTQGLVCAVGNNQAEGCFDSRSYESCTCKCQDPNNCNYWAFFTQAKDSGRWVYSALGFFLARAKDGELQAWKWGRGGPNSAPAPPLVTFEQVCGHAPRGGLKVEPTATPTAISATATPALAPPTAATVTATAATAATAASTPATAAVSPAAAPSGAATATLATATPVAAASAAATASQGTAPPTATAPPPSSFTITAHGTATAAPPATGGGESGSSGGRGGVVAFAAVATLLLAGIGGAAVAVRRRQRHGA